MDWQSIAFVVYTSPHHPISHFFNKKIWQSINYNKNGCKFAKRVNLKEYYILY